MYKDPSHIHSVIFIYRPSRRDPMILSPLSLLNHIKLGRLIRNLSDRELNTPEGVGFDLQLESIYEISNGSGSLLVDTRKTPEHLACPTNTEGYFVLSQGKTYLATTREEFDLPNDIACIFFPRSTLFRSGVIFQSSTLPPGYVGPMTFSITNTHHSDFIIERGARFAHAVFLSITGDIQAYRGQWQGGRVSQPNDETQI